MTEHYRVWHVVEAPCDRVTAAGMADAAQDYAGSHDLPPGTEIFVEVVPTPEATRYVMGDRWVEYMGKVTSL